MYKISVIICFILLVILNVLSKRISYYTKKNIDIIKRKATITNSTQEDNKNSKSFTIKGPITYVIPFIPILNILFIIILSVLVLSQIFLFVSMKNVVNS